LKITKIWVENAGPIATRKEIQIPNNGLSVFYAENELGKSTLARVPHLLNQFDYATDNSKIKSLRNITNPSSPVILGMEYSIGAALYSIEKRFLSAPSAVFKQLKPNLSQFENKSAEAEFAKTLSQIDQTLLTILNPAQGQNLSIHNSGFGKNKALSRFLEQASSPIADDRGEVLTDLLDRRWKSFFTETGKASTKSNTKGAQLALAQNRVDELLREVALAKDKFRRIEERRSRESLKLDASQIKLYLQCRQLRREISELEARLSRISEAEDAYTVCEIEVPAAWEEPLHNTLKNTYPAYVAISSAARFILKAKIEQTITVGETSHTLNENEVLPIALTKNQIIDLGEYATLEISGLTSDEDRLREYDTHLETLRILGINSLTQSEEIREKVRLKNALDIANADKSKQEINQELSVLEEFRAANKLAWDDCLNYPDLTADDAELANRLEYEIEFLMEDEVTVKLEENERNLESEKAQLSKLMLERDAISLLTKILAEKRSKIKSELSPLFQADLNSISEQIFGSEYIVSVSDSLEIETRSRGQIPIDPSRLSIGAVEALGLLIRLSVCNIASQDEPLPLILDDEFAYVDAPTITSFMTFLNSKSDQQVILFTHQPSKFSSAIATSL